MGTVPWTEGLNLVRMTILLKLMFRFNVHPTESQSLFCKWETDSKFQWKSKSNNVKEENQSWETSTFLILDAIELWHFLHEEKPVGGKRTESP